jgi:formylmethanofuran dehydrogenase subunit E
MQRAVSSTAPWLPLAARTANPNIEKLYCNKVAFTLIDVKGQRSVRVRLKGGFFAKVLESPFVAQRKGGVPPQDIPAEIADPLVAKVLSMPEEMFLEIGRVESSTFQRGKGNFEIKPCAVCGEMAFTDKLAGTNGGLICGGCRDAE